MRFILRRRAGGVLTSGLVLALAMVALLLTIPSFTSASAPASGASLPHALGTTYTVTWNTVDVSTASSTSSALSVDFTQSATVWFNWSGTSSVTIANAQLQMFYFGFAVTTRTVTETNPTASASGHIPLTWTPLSIAYVLAGLYKITASFIAPNGTTMFSENFYLRATALYGFVAAIPIVLLIIAIYEVYALVRSGRYAMLGRKPATPPPSTPPPKTPESAPPTESAPTEGETPSATPPVEETPPASGGSS